MVRYLTRPVGASEASGVGDILGGCYGWRMANTTKTLMALALAGASAWGAWSIGSGLLGEDSSADGTQWVVNHVWLERIPENERDMIGHLALIQHPRMRIGVAGRSSQWRHLVELYKWGLEGHRLSLYFPQEQAKAHVKVRTWRCKGEAPEPFEICLEISSGRRTAVYYSREEWVIEPHDAEGSAKALASTSPELAAVFEHAIVDGPPSEAELERDEETFAEVDWLPE